jgi:hypothetical protein
VSLYCVHWGGKNRFSCVSHGRSVAHCCLMLRCAHQQYCHERCLLVYGRLAPATPFVSPFHWPNWKHHITTMFSCTFCPICFCLLLEEVNHFAVTESWQYLLTQQTALLDGIQRIQGSNSGTGRQFSLLQSSKTGSWVDSSFCPMKYVEYSSGYPVA